VAAKSVHLPYIRTLLSVGPWSFQLFRESVFIAFIHFHARFSSGEGDGIGVGTGNFWEVKRIVYPARIYPNLPEKILCDKFSLYKFSVVSDTFCFPPPCCHTLENRKFGTWNLVFNHPTENVRWLCKNIVRSQLTLSVVYSYICLAVLRFGVPFSIHIPYITVSKKPPHLAENIYMQHNVWQNVFLQNCT